MPASSLRYFENVDPALRRTLSVAPHNLGEFSRHLLFQQGMQSELAEVDAVLARMPGDPVWQAILRKYGLDTPARAARR